MIYDTNFLIALQGRKKGFYRSQALEWMRRNGGVRFFTSRMCVLEFAAGFASDAEADHHLVGFTILPIDTLVLAETTRVMRELCRAGQPIGAADSIIAATARLYGLPLVTENTRHFKRVSGIDVRGYLPTV